MNGFTDRSRSDMAPHPIPLQEGAVYGPIRSRRFGNSLGINVLPIDRKVCSSNCVYCQYGWTRPGTSGQGLRRSPELLDEIAAAFQRHADAGTAVDCLTLAGNGEPTLHPDLIELVNGLKALRDRYFVGVPVGILSDATQITRPRVREALELLDLRCLKFDAADASTWKRINQPLTAVTFEAMVEVLRRTPEIVLQSLFLQGAYDNTDEAHLRTWIDAVGLIKPLFAQVYTVDRPTAASGITAVPRRQLQEIADRLTAATGVRAEIFD